MKLLCAATFAAFFLSLSSLSAAAAQSDSNRTSESADDAKVIKCKRTREVGSRIPKKICHTKEEWLEIERDSAEALRNSQSRSSTCGDSGPC